MGNHVRDIWSQKGTGYVPGVHMPLGTLPSNKMVLFEKQASLAATGQAPSTRHLQHSWSSYRQVTESPRSPGVLPSQEGRLAHHGPAYNRPDRQSRGQQNTRNRDELPQNGNYPPMNGQGGNRGKTREFQKLRLFFFFSSLYTAVLAAKDEQI